MVCALIVAATAGVALSATVLQPPAQPPQPPADPLPDALAAEPAEAYVYDPSGNSIDVQLVAGGFARAWARDGQHRDVLVGLEQSAKSNQAGCLWTGGSFTETGQYAPSGPDRDCGDFGTWREANDFYVAAGGPERDLHQLDGDGDGVPCESLR